MTAITGSGAGGGVGPVARPAPARPAPVAAPPSAPAPAAKPATSSSDSAGAHSAPAARAPQSSGALQAAQAALEAQSQEQQKAMQAKAQENLKEMQRRLDEAIERLKEQMKQNQTKLGFVVDSATDRLIVKVMNKETGEVLRQIPGEAVIKIARSIESMKGMFFDQQL